MLDEDELLLEEEELLDEELLDEEELLLPTFSRSVQPAVMAAAAMTMDIRFGITIIFLRCLLSFPFPPPYRLIRGLFESECTALAER